MTDLSTQTALLQGLLDRLRSGDRAARNELFRGIGRRLELLAQKMLRTFPAVRRLAEAEDVVQNAILRLLRALDQVQPLSVQDFLNLAAVHLRRELLDLARQCGGPKGQVACCCSPLKGNGTEGPQFEPAAADDAGEIDDWCAFHQEVEKLPVEEREVVGLVFYHGWGQAQVAELFHVSERTVRRRWETALAKLQHVLKKH
jgi:RNA polymerase sigma factor (sigma-70 family)